MVVVLNKRNTSWTFTYNGAFKQTKAGKSYYPELALGLTATNEFIDGLVEKKWKLEGDVNYKEFKRSEYESIF